MTKAESALSTIPAIRLRLLPALLAAAGLLAATQVAAQRLPTPLAAPEKVSVEGQTASSGRVRVIVQFAEAPVTRMRDKMDVSRANRAEMVAASCGGALGTDTMMLSTPLAPLPNMPTPSGGTTTWFEKLVPVSLPLVRFAVFPASA